MILTARYLTKIYKPKMAMPWHPEPEPAIDRICFELGAGETLAIIGAAGSGKTTLARVLAGAETVTTGTLVMEGERVDAVSSDEYHRSIRMMFQDPSASLNPNLSIGRQLDSTLKLAISMPEADRKQRVLDTLQDVGLLHEHIDFYPDQLSSGLKHRVALARALITNPKVIIADESLSSVDVSVRAKLINLLLKLQRERDLSYIMITHDREIIEHMCDKLMVLQSGRTIEYGQVEQILNQPKEAYSRQLLAL
ncbi:MULTISPECIES: ATP-binding cassette domain-containing protein [Corallincola]|uniref:ABC transporter ATP-binding protein n=3 Tax=Corallincola TaxID=1775176 RepID=A0A368MZG5_9GAMM|nr:MULTISPECIES: ATP-binding cassette domain-containing protein [Corallincola]RCU43657.1 ABC transporter ATP-binding protein [Corallincola holothuriorum]TAA42734.1 ABC transporter ATP-binding protein [Corallincola spongiicola]TCI01615.1 ABC transporter ATP-binding protein [Corallincola luteus]